MKLYHSLVPLLVIAQDDDPLADWEIRDLSLQCGFDTPTELTFEVYPGDIDLDTSTFHARDCSYGDLTEVITEAVTENLPADQQDKGRKKYTVKYNPNTCMSTVADPANLGTYASNVTFNFDFGYEHQSVFMHMRTYRIPAICSFQSQYNLKFDFGKIEQGIVETNGTDLQPINGGIVFDFNVYKDSALTEPVYNTNSGLKTGQMVYFTIVPQFNFPSGLQYAPPVCQFLQETCDEDDNCNVHQEFSLFDHEVDECQQPPSSPLQFDLSYIQSTDEWRSQFRLFLFGEDIDQSTFTLRCEVDVCVDTCSSDVVVANQQCGNIARTCLSSASYLEYNNQCMQCGVGQQANNINDACEDCPANTYNDDASSIDNCKTCPANSFSASGAVECVTCEDGNTWNESTGSCVSPGIPASNPSFRGISWERLYDTDSIGDVFLACGQESTMRTYNMTTKEMIHDWPIYPEIQKCKMNDNYIFGIHKSNDKVYMYDRATNDLYKTLNVHRPADLICNNEYLFVATDHGSASNGNRHVRISDIETSESDSLDAIAFARSSHVNLHYTTGMAIDSEAGTIFVTSLGGIKKKFRISDGAQLCDFDGEAGKVYGKQSERNPVVYGEYILTLNFESGHVVAHNKTTCEWIHGLKGIRHQRAFGIKGETLITIDSVEGQPKRMITYDLDKWLVEGKRTLAEVTKRHYTDVPNHVDEVLHYNFFRNEVWMTGSSYKGIQIFSWN